ncbi:hypothetical protein [Thiomonas sp.]
MERERDQESTGKNPDVQEQTASFWARNRNYILVGGGVLIVGLVVLMLMRGRVGTQAPAGVSVTSASPTAAEGSTGTVTGSSSAGHTSASYMAQVTAALKGQQAQSAKFQKGVLAQETAFQSAINAANQKTGMTLLSQEKSTAAALASQQQQQAAAASSQQAAFQSSILSQQTALRRSVASQNAQLASAVSSLGTSFGQQQRAMAASQNQFESTVLANQSAATTALSQQVAALRSSGPAPTTSAQTYMAAKTQAANPASEGSPVSSGGFSSAASRLHGLSVAYFAYSAAHPGATLQNNTYLQSLHATAQGIRSQYPGAGPSGGYTAAQLGG